MIPYSKQTIDSKDIKALADVIKSDWLTTGPKIIEFEKALSNYCRTRYAVAVSSGTAALHLAYLAAGLKKDDEVITSPNTFVSTTNMMIAVGAKPVFCDIRLDNYNIDETKIERLITKKTKAIVPVHFSGHPCEMDKIWKIAKKYNLLVIEDAAHALGAKYKNKKVGGLRSSMTIFSFHPVKSIAIGEGGAILTNNKKYYEKLKLIRSHGITKDKNGFNVMLEFGYNYRLTEMQAGIGITQLKKVNAFVASRNKKARYYDARLKDVSEIILPQKLPKNLSARHLYIIRTKKISDRMKLYNYLLKNGIGVNFHYPCVYKHPYYRKNNFAKTTKNNSEIYHKTAITIPLYPLLSNKGQDYIIKKIKSYFKK